MSAARYNCIAWICARLSVSGKTSAAIASPWVNMRHRPIATSTAEARLAPIRPPRQAISNTIGNVTNKKAGASRPVKNTVSAASPARSQASVRRSEGSPARNAGVNQIIRVGQTINRPSAVAAYQMMKPEKNGSPANHDSKAAPHAALTSGTDRQTMTRRARPHGDWSAASLPPNRRISMAVAEISKRSASARSGAGFAPKTAIATVSAT